MSVVSWILKVSRLPHKNIHDKPMVGLLPVYNETREIDLTIMDS